MAGSSSSSECPHIPSCELFPKLVATLSYWQKGFCFKNPEVCARYQAALEGNPVSIELLPNEQQLAPAKS